MEGSQRDTVSTSHISQFCMFPALHLHPPVNQPLLLVTNFEEVNIPPTQRPTLRFSTRDYNTSSPFLSPQSRGRQCLLEFGPESKQLKNMEIWEDQHLALLWGWKFEFEHGF